MYSNEPGVPPHYLSEGKAGTDKDGGIGTPNRLMQAQEHAPMPARNPTPNTTFADVGTYWLRAARFELNFFCLCLVLLRGTFCRTGGKKAEIILCILKDTPTNTQLIKTYTHIDFK